MRQYNIVITNLTLSHSYIFDRDKTMNDGNTADEIKKRLQGQQHNYTKVHIQTNNVWIFDSYKHTFCFVQ